jgi:hypothetical protein
MIDSMQNEDVATANSEITKKSLARGYKYDQVKKVVFILVSNSSNVSFSSPHSPRRPTPIIRSSGMTSLLFNRRPVNRLQMDTRYLFFLNHPLSSTVILR